MSKTWVQVRQYVGDTLLRFSIENLAIYAVYLVMAIVSAITAGWIASDASAGDFSHLELVAIGLLIALFLAFIWLIVGIGFRFYRANNTSPSRPEYISSYNQASFEEPPDMQTYNDALRFVWEHLLPACEAQIELQKAVVDRMCDNEIIAQLAKTGLSYSDLADTWQFWKYYDDLTYDIDGSEPTIQYHNIIKCVAGLENHNYRKFCGQLDALVNDEFDYRTDEITGPTWEKWRKRHNEMIVEYDNIKKDVRFGKLFRRPRHPSRWGAKIAPISSVDEALERLSFRGSQEETPR